MVEYCVIIEGWLFTHKGGDGMSIKDKDKGFKEALREVRDRGVVLVPE